MTAPKVGRGAPGRDEPGPGEAGGASPEGGADVGGGSAGASAGGVSPAGSVSGVAGGGAGGDGSSGGGRRGRAARRTGRRTGRRGGDSGTREAILTAARAKFGEAGYDRATIRGIAADAGVDPALVHHFFGPKERLFAAAMRLPLVPTDVIDRALTPAGADETQGEHALRTVLQMWGVAEVREGFLGFLRTAVTSEQAVVMLREFAIGAILSRIAAAARAGREAATGPAGPDPGSGDTGSGGTDAQFRAALVASQVLGLALTRYVLELPPLIQASDEELVAAIGPTLDRYLTADLAGDAPQTPDPRPTSGNGA